MRGVLRRSAQRVFETLPLPLRYYLWGRWQTPPSHYYLPRRERRQVVRESQTIRRRRSEPSFWFLPTHTWFSSGFQRPQQLARALAEIGCSVVFCEPWKCARSFLTEETLEQRQFRGWRRVEENLWLLRVPGAMIRRLLDDAAPTAVMMTWPHQANFVRGLRKSCVVYEMIDDHSLIPHVDDRWRAIHDHYVRHAAVVTGTADELVSQLRQVRPDALLLPNGVRMEDWHARGAPGCPSDLCSARQKHMVVGYYGAIAPWFDWDMWLTAAQLKPEWAFVLIGYAYDGNVQAVHARIGQLHNVYFLGPKAYRDLPNYLAWIDVATIPFVLNRITHGCSPVKLFEYMAAGKPIVCSPMREILKYQSVHFAASGPAFVTEIQKAFEGRNREEYRRLLQEEAEANTWRARATSLRAALEATRTKGKTGVRFLPEHQTIPG